MNGLADFTNESKTGVAVSEFPETAQTSVDADAAKSADSGQFVDATNSIDTGKSADEGDKESELTPEQAMLRLHAKIETQVLKYFQNKEIARERNEENKMIFEELEELFEQLGDDEVVISLPSGQNAVLNLSIREKEVLDVDMLADEMKVPKDELKTPFDYCAFTAKGKLTPAMITKHTSVERESKLKISKRKATAKRRKKSATESES